MRERCAGGQEDGEIVREDAQAVFVAMFRDHFRELVRLAALLGADDADDVVQEAFARLPQHSSRLREPDRAFTYTRTTVVNLCRSRLRRLPVARRPHPHLLIAESAMPESAAVLPEDQAEVSTTSADPITRLTAVDVTGSTNVLQELRTSTSSGYLVVDVRVSRP